MTKHEELVEAARAAIQAVFGDTSVGRDDTLNSLEELRSEIKDSCDALRQDIRRDEGR